MEEMGGLRELSTLAAAFNQREEADDSGPLGEYATGGEMPRNNKRLAEHVVDAGGLEELDEEQQLLLGHTREEIRATAQSTTHQQYDRLFTEYTDFAKELYGDTTIDAERASKFLFYQAHRPLRNDTKPKEGATGVPKPKTHLNSIVAACALSPFVVLYLSGHPCIAPVGPAWGSSEGPTPGGYYI
jgi:hypothetical protein